MNVFSKQMIVKGQLRNCSNKKRYAYSMRVLRNSDLPSILGLYDFVVAKMKDPNMLWRYDDQMVAEFLGEDGIVGGVFVEDRLVAVRVVYFHHEGDLTNPLMYKEDAYGETAHLALCVVHPDFRGNSLQKKLGVYLLQIAQTLRAFPTMCSVVSPHNYPSMSDKFSLNMVVVKLMPKFKGVWRYIFYRNMNKPVVARSETMIFVASGDYQRQIELLEHGYYGVQLGRNNGEIGMFFKQFTLKVVEN